MPPPPKQPKIYHITHIDNLSSIIAANGLKSDAFIAKEQGPTASIGMPRIKARRLCLPVICYPKGYVGDYVPFYFCPRSVMLYQLHKANNPDIPRKDGQEPILHLEADLYAVIRWANDQRQKWAFSLSNAGANYTEFRNKLENLDEINWQAVASNTWYPKEIQEGKQAEFLLHESFPWHLFERIGVCSTIMEQRVMRLTEHATYKPLIKIMTTWYY